MKQRREIINNSTYIATDVNVGLSYAWLTWGQRANWQKAKGACRDGSPTVW